MCKLCGFFLVFLALRKHSADQGSQEGGHRQTETEWKEGQDCVLRLLKFRPCSYSVVYLSNHAFEIHSVYDAGWLINLFFKRQKEQYDALITRSILTAADGTFYIIRRILTV